jgi:hypothetical protein
MKVLLFLFIASSVLAQERTGTWLAPKQVTNDSMAYIHHFFFADSLTGYMCTEEKIDPLRLWLHKIHWYRTLDGGTTWDKILFSGMPTDTINYIFSVKYSTPTSNSVYLEGGYPLNKIVYSTDRGSTWKSTSYPVNTLDLDEYFTMQSETIGKGVGLDGNSQRSIIRTSNGPTGFTTSLAVGDSLFAASMTASKATPLQGLSWIPADFSDLSNGCFIIRDPSLNECKGLTTLVTNAGGHWWSKYNTIFPGYETDSLYGDLQFQKATSNAWLTPFKYRFSCGWPDFILTVLVNHPEFNISYCYTEDYGETWKIDTSFFLRNSYVFGVSAGNVWMTILESSLKTYSDKIYPPAYLLGHTTDYGKTWDVDETSLNVQDLGKFDARLFYFTDKDHGWIAALHNAKPWVFKYKPNQPSVVRDNDPAKNLHTNLDYTINPNPCGASTLITFPQDIVIKQVKLFDELGRKVIVPFSISGNSVQLNTEKIPNGLWSALIEHQNGISIVRFIVKK